MINKTSFEFKIVIWFFFLNRQYRHFTCQRWAGKYFSRRFACWHISKHLIRKLLKKVKRLYSTSLSEYQTVFFILFQYNTIGKLKWFGSYLHLYFLHFYVSMMFSINISMYTIAFEYPSNTCKCWFIVFSINSKYHFVRFPVTCIHFHDT